MTVTPVPISGPAAHGGIGLVTVGAERSYQQYVSGSPSGSVEFDPLRMIPWALLVGSGGAVGCWFWLRRYTPLEISVSSGL